MSMPFVRAESSTKVTLTVDDSKTDNGKFAKNTKFSLKTKNTSIKTIKYRTNKTNSYETYKKSFSLSTGSYTINWKGYDSSNKEIAKGKEKLEIKSNSSSSSSNYISDISKKVSSDKKSLKLAWKASNKEKINKIKLYRNKKETFEPSSDNMLISGSNTLSNYTDSTIKKGKTYYYKIQTLDKAGKVLGTYSTKVII